MEGLYNRSFSTAILGHITSRLEMHVIGRKVLFIRKDSKDEPVCVVIQLSNDLITGLVDIRVMTGMQGLGFVSYCEARP